MAMTHDYLDYLNQRVGIAPANSQEELQAAMKRGLEQNRNRLRLYVERMKGLSPLDRLARGYSHVEDEAGRTVSDIGRIAPGDLLAIYMKNGRALAEVKETSPWEPFSETDKGVGYAG